MKSAFNRYVNLGISSEDMLIRLDGYLEERDLEPFRIHRLKICETWATALYVLEVIFPGM